MKPRLDPSEAPKGYRAAPPHGDGTFCLHCDFDCAHVAADCEERNRKDGCNVRFVKAPERPSPEATFARHLAKESYDFPWLNHVHKDAFAKLTVRLMRRAWNAGRRAARKERN